MGPKKKGKGSKLARMSEEEKIRYLQHRAAVEEEARRRKEQLISTFMKNKLKHEEAFTRLNSAKINEQWRHLLRKYKCSELKDDMKALWQSFETTLTLKNKVIETLLTDLEEAEVQYSMMFQSHSETVGNIIDVHGERLQKLFGMYTKDRRKMLSRAAEIRKNIVETGNRRCEHLQAVVFESNNRHKKHQQATNNLLQHKQDELRDEMVTEREKAEEIRHSQIETQWYTVQQLLQNYNSSIAPMRVHYKSLIERDTNNSAELLNHCDTINKYSDSISRLRQHLVTKQKDHEEEMNLLKKQQTELLKRFQKLRNSVTDENKLAHIKLTKMSVASSSVIEKLEKVVDKGNNILNFNLNCQKYLTQNEKILPSYCKGPVVIHSDSKEELNDDLNTSEVSKTEETKSVDDVEELEEENDSIPEPFNKLGNFWKQYNSVLIECESLRMHHESCTAENRQLKRLLRHYLNTLTRPSSVPNISATRSCRPTTAITTGPRTARKR